MSTKIVAQYCVYHDDLWLPLSFESVYPAVDAIHFLLGERPWNGPATDNTTTLKCIQSLPDPEGKVQVFSKAWTDEVSQRNEGLALATVQGFDYSMGVDCDEVYAPAQLKAVREVLTAYPEVGCWHLWMHTYWKSYRYRIDPLEQFTPPIFVKTGAGGYVGARQVAATSHEVIPASIAVCHHLSYARSTELIERKFQSFSHSHQIVPNWMEKVWRAWDENPELENLHPVNPPQYPRAVLQDPDAYPPVLRGLYESEALGLSEEGRKR